MFSAELINKFSQIETPFYYYDLDLLQKNLSVLKKCSQRYGFKIHYALKANANHRILKEICQSGFGADCVSGNEILTAMDCGFPHHQIVFAGVGKTDKEIALALQRDIQCLNCESMQELEVVNRLAGEKGKVAPVAIRLNPNLEAQTHHYITTGKEENKFGIKVTELEPALDSFEKYTNLKFLGLHFHIGSQITNLEVFKSLCRRVNQIQHDLKKKGINPKHLNLGGGLGVDYRKPDEHFLPDYDGYFRIFNENLKTLPGQSVHFELGRSIVASCGALICRVLYIKEGFNTRFAVVDAGMTELIRPALYQAYHKIENLTADSKAGHKGIEKYDVVGPVCESSDFLGKSVTLPVTQRSDLLAVRTTGAYAEVMASKYNLRDLARSVYSDELS